MPRLHRLAPYMPRQQTPRPQFGSVAQFLRFRARQMNDPRPRFLRDDGSARAMIRILERGLRAHGTRRRDSLSNALARHLHGPSDARYRFASMIAAQNPRTLHLSQ